MKLEEEEVLVNGIKNRVCTLTREPIAGVGLVSAKVYLRGLFVFVRQEKIS